MIAAPTRHYGLTPTISATIREVVAAQTDARKALGDVYYCPDCGALPGVLGPRQLLIHLATCDRYLAVMGAPILPISL